MSDARNRKNVLVGAPNVKASGGAMLGDVVKAADVPKDATSEVTVPGQRPVGYVSEDGVVKTVDRSTEKIKDWNGDTVIVLTTDHSVTLKVTVLEAANAGLLKSIFGAENVKIEGNTITTIDNGDDLPHNSWQFDIKAGADASIRLFAPDAQVTSVGDVNFVRSDVIKYELEIECFTDDANNKFYQFIDRGDAEGETSGVVSSEGATETA